MSDRKWFFFQSDKKNRVFVAGYYPSDFDWTVETLPRRIRELKKVCFIMDGSGIYSPINIGCMPLPMFLYSEVTNYISHEKYCQLVRVQWGDLSRNRVVIDRVCKAFVPVLRTVYSSFSDVPKDEHFAIVSGRFFFDEVALEAFKRMIVVLNGVYYYPSSKANKYPIIAYPPKNFDHLFVKRPPMDEGEAMRRVFEFCMESLRKFSLEKKGEHLGAILLDTDPQYGYVIMALKTSAARSIKELDDIERYEYDNYAGINEDKLYGGCEYLSERKLTGVLAEAIRKLAEERLVRDLARPEGLRIGYAVHDRHAKWIAEVGIH